MEQKASITIFLSLIVVLVTVLLCSFLEAARLEGLRTYANMRAEMTTESLFAEYDAELFAEYGILLRDISDGDGKIQWQQMWNTAAAQDAACRKQDTNTVQLYPLQLMSVDTMQYELATDDGGNAFRRQVVALMKEELPYALARSVYDQQTQKYEKATEQNAEEKIKEAKQAIQEADQQKENEQNEQTQQIQQNTDVSTEAEDDNENPIELVQKYKKKEYWHFSSVRKKYRKKP